MAYDTMVVDMLLQRMVETLVADCQTPFGTEDVTRATIVKKGLLQTAKVENVVQLGVTGGDHEDPNLRDGIITLESMQNIGLEMMPREVGGGQYWWRRGVVRIEAFWINKRLNEDDSHKAAYSVLGRVEESIDKMSVTGLVDSFGEGVHYVFCFGNTFFESGGGSNQYIFRGKVFWQALTERPR